VSSQKRIGDLLVDAGVITAAQLADALARQMTEGEARIASEILGLGLAHERQIAEAMSVASGHPTLVFSESTLDLGPLAQLPQSIAEQHTILPIAADEDTVTVAAADVDSRPIFQQVSFATGKRVVAVLAIDQLLKAAIPDCYAIAGQGQRLLKGTRSSHDTPHLELARDAVKEDEDEAVAFVKSLSGFEERSGEYSVKAPMRVEDGKLIEPKAPVRPDAPDGYTIPDGASLGRVDLKQMVVPVMPAPASTPHAQVDGPKGKQIVLVVEDDDAIRTLVARSLTHDGFHVIEAPTGDHAVDQLRTTKPDLVVLDAMLPGMHGFEICARMKTAEMYADVKVVMVSAVYRGWEHAREIQEVHGADVFVEKPFDVHYLRKVVAEQLGKELQRAQLPPDRAQQVAGLRYQLDQHRVLGAWGQALQCVARWLEIDPFDPLAHLEAGNLQSQQQNFEGAMRSYEAAVVYDKRLFEAQSNLALVYERLGFRRKAIEGWRRALTIAPEDAVRGQIEERLQNMIG
jgi:DNA-binding response OmpR family regulator